MTDKPITLEARHLSALAHAWTVVNESWRDEIKESEVLLRTIPGLLTEDAELKIQSAKWEKLAQDNANLAEICQRNRDRLQARVAELEAIHKAICSAARRGEIVSATTPPKAPATVDFSINLLVDYVEQYGGRCRDCADFGPVCPGSGLPCGDSKKAIEHVIAALKYGAEHGYLNLRAFFAQPATIDNNAELVGMGCTHDNAPDNFEPVLQNSQIMQLWPDVHIPSVTDVLNFARAIERAAVLKGGAAPNNYQEFPGCAMTDPAKFRYPSSNTFVFNNAPSSHVTFSAPDGSELLKVAAYGFYVRGVQIECDENEARQVYEALKGALMQSKPITNANLQRCYEIQRDELMAANQRCVALAGQRDRLVVVLKDASDYLDRNVHNQISSRSVLHNRMRESIAAIQGEKK